MDQNQSNLAVRKLLAKYSHTDPDDWFLTFRARFGMATCFQAIYDIYGSGEVITQPYTCITAINPILVSNLKPVYADINPETLSINQPEKVYSSKTVAIVLQHTLGIIGDKSQKIANFAKKHRLILVEDSAHCLARMAKHKCPRYIDFVDSFPMNAAGKILKYKMREQAVEKLKLHNADSIVTA